MEELTKLVMEQAQVSEDQAAASIQAVSKYIKDRIPKVVHSQFDKILSGMSLEDSIKGQFEGVGSEVKERAENLAKDLKSAFEEAFQSKKGNNP